MKKILLFALIVLSMSTCMAQSKFNKGIMVGDKDGNRVLIDSITEDGYGVVQFWYAGAAYEAPDPPSIRTATESDTLTLADNKGTVHMNVATINYLTVPTNATVAFSVGDWVAVVNAGAGQTVVNPADGVTVNSLGGDLGLNGQWSSATLRKTGTNTWMLYGDIAAAGEAPAYELPEPHPMTHDQTYLSHKNVQDGDYIGQVHYLCTDSIFNDRSVGTYSWSIVSGNTSDAFSVTSSGMLTVSNSAAVTTDFTLGVEITHGDKKDTATCTVLYKSGVEGTNLFYVDPDDGGGSPAGTFANPYQNLTALDDFGEFDNGKTVLIKRGSRQSVDQWQIDNQGNRIYIGAYGTGVRPIIEVLDATDERIFQLGAYPGVENTDDCDSLTIMDLTLKGIHGDYTHYAIYNEGPSDNNEFHRIWCDSIINGNGTIYCYGEDNVALKFWDIEVSNSHTTYGRRALKSESWGIEIENMYVHDIRYSSLMCGQYSHDWGSAKYLYFKNMNPVYGEAAIQLRSPGIEIEWLATHDYYYGVDFQNYDYFAGDEPAVRDISVSNAVIEGSGYGVRFSNPAGATTDVFDTITLDGLRIIDPEHTGIRLITSTNTMDFDNVVVKNCIVTGSPDYGVNVNHAEQGDVSIQNCIFFNSTTTDVYTTGAVAAGVFRNNIYQSITDIGHWNTAATNYDYDSGNPFVNVSGGDYQTAASADNVIDSGTDISQSYDVLGYPITTQDIGPFEYGGDKFNWTDRE